MLMLDHIAVAGETLEAAAAHVEAALGLSMDPGGVHVEMGTHNRLLNMGAGQYLEAIAINPDAPELNRPRWFDLDGFEGPPRLTNWIVRADDLAAALTEAPDGMGVPIPFTRGRYAWTMAVPGTGRLPWDGAAPALIQWDAAAHPADALPDRGLRLASLEIAHPAADDLCAAFPALKAIPDVSIAPGPAPKLRATIETPSGLRTLE